MPYLFHLSARAERDLVQLYDDIGAADSSDALKWYYGPKDAILSLEEYPDRCPVTPENTSLRHLLYGHRPHMYRVIYRVVASHKRVEVLHIRHGARRRFTLSNLP